MKLTTIFLIATVLQVSAKSVAQTVSYSAKSVPLEKVFSAVREQTGYLFFYDPAMLRDCKPVNIQAEKIPLETFIRNILADQPVTYSIENKTIFITRKPPSTAGTGIAAYVPIFVIGRIIGADGIPLSGATVTIKRTKTGTNADANGNYVIKNLEDTDTLVFSFIGYKTHLEPVKGRNQINVVMEATTSPLDEVVVQAYGRTTQRFTTGNIVTIRGEEIAKQPVMDPLLALQGRVAGMIITPQSGYEGGPLKVEIRGRSSINPDFTSDPLYIIDGIPLTVLDLEGTRGNRRSQTGGSYSRGLDVMGLSFSGGLNPLFGINPSDIESIEILKDADATAIYGSRGANGVILVTTKKGKAGKNTFTANVNSGVNVITRFWHLLETPDYLAMRKEAFKNDNIIPNNTNAPDLKLFDSTKYTDWQRYAYGGTGNWLNVQTSLSGGNAQTTYRVAAGYNSSSDITTVSGVNRRMSLSANLTTRSLNKRFEMNVQTGYSFSEMNQVSITALSTLPPNAPDLFDSTGAINYKAYRNTGLSNPAAGLFTPFNQKARTFTGSLNMSYNIVKGLYARVNVGGNMGLNDQSYFRLIANQDPVPPPSSPKPTGSNNFGNNSSSNISVEPMLEYTSVLGKGSLNLLVGGTWQSNVTKGTAMAGTNYTSDLFIKSITAAPTVTVNDLYGEYKYTGVFARAGYNYENKYIINLNARRDGSSRFGPENRFGNFGSVGAAWIASEEKWIRAVLPQFFSFVKLRGSYGLTGSDGVGDYKYLTQYGNLSPQLTNYNGVVPLSPQILENPDFHWQVNKKLEGSLAIGLVDNRFNIEAAVYRNRCNNQLVSFPIPEIAGFGNVVLNSPANVQNSGVEITFNANVINGKDFKWFTAFNWAKNRNILLSYPLFEQSPYYATLRIGGSLNDTWVYEYLGVDPKTGEFQYRDFNNDGVISNINNAPRGQHKDDLDMAINMAPEFFGGMQNMFSYKSISLTAAFSYTKQIGRNAFNLLNFGGMQNVSYYQYENRWHGIGQEAEFAKATTLQPQSSSKFTSSSGQFTDASFIRLTTLALAYNMPTKWIRKIGMSNLNISMNAQNLFVITGYQGIDPETQSLISMQRPKTITFGLSANF